jgi:CubicO group peptidase (beta-lactamase class C family)
MSQHIDSNRSTRFLSLLCALTLLAGCASPATTAVAPPAPTSTPGVRSATPETPGTASLAATVVPTSTAASAAYWPTQGWRTSSPEEQGMDAQQLAEMLKVIKEKKLNLHSLLIIRNGYLVSETYFGSYQQGDRHELYSCTKSFIATLIGIALDKGYLKGTDQRILDFFPKQTFANPDERKSAMTLEDTLTMRTGLDWEEGDPAYRAMYRSSDWVKYVLDEPMVAAPGKQFNYCSGCSHVLSAILQQATGTDTREFADQYLFQPLGISHVVWDVDSSAIAIGGWGLQLTPRDMAKLGYLYLHQGQWDGQQVVSAKWVEDATRTHAEAGDDLDYGYQWWTYSALGAYMALGRYGQTILVIPELDLIVVTTAQMDNHDEIFNLVQHHILPAVQEAQ